MLDIVKIKMMHHNIMYNNNTKRICKYKLIKYISTIALTILQEDNTIKQISTIVDILLRIVTYSVE